MDNNTINSQESKDLLLVQRSLGHANPRTTAKYAHVNNDIVAAEVIDLE